TEIVADVVTTKGKHCEGIASYLTDRPCRRGSRFRAHRCRLIDAFVPTPCLYDQGNRIRSPAAENEGRDRHTIGVIPFRIERRTLRDCSRKTRIRMRGIAPAARCP